MNVLLSVLAYWPIALVCLLAWAALSIFAAMFLRVVVPTNEVHIVQSRRKTVSFGKDQGAGNCYYKWPAWLPRIGIRVITLPVSVFDIRLTNYAAYDKGRVPFCVDILAFFRIESPNDAAQRVSSFKELSTQLEGILQGASRSILAQSPIEEILEERAKYGKMFTDATNEQLKAWGVTNVKAVELMDLRDSENSKVIQNIMAVKSSSIQRESRMAVAQNNQQATQAEIEAERAIQFKKQEAEESVGVRLAQKEQATKIADQKAQQAVQEEAKHTAEKQMAVNEVNTVRAAEIAKAAQMVQADQERQVAVIRADGEKQRTVTIAEGTLAQAKLHAEGIKAEGDAKGAAETALLMAPVTAQTTLAKEIGENKGYQEYLVTIRKVEAGQAVGIAQAEALKAAQIKVIANAGSVTGGVESAMEILTAKGGTAIGGFLEALKQSETGAEILQGVARTVNGNGQQQH